MTVREDKNYLSANSESKIKKKNDCNIVDSVSKEAGFVTCCGLPFFS